MTGHTDKNLYIIGAGFAGQMLAEEIARKKIFGNVIAFLDDDQQLIGTHIDGIPVLGPINTMTPLLRRQDNDEAIIAIPTASSERLKEIFNVLRARGFSKIKILPAISLASLCQSSSSAGQKSVCRNYSSIQAWCYCYDCPSARFFRQGNRQACGGAARSPFLLQRNDGFGRTRKRTG